VRRPILRLAAAVSLALCAATIVLWVRSYRPRLRAAEADSLNLTHRDPYWWFVSNPGRLIFCHQAGKDWDSPRPKFQIMGLEYAGSWVGESSLVNLLIPYWMLVLSLLVLPAAGVRAVAKDRARRRRIRLGFCGNCGYDLTGSTTRCPECGKMIPSHADLTQGLR
jgi:hypothetical protein